jgi:hypothetical protein
MPAALAHFQRRFHPVLCQVVLLLEQVLHGVLVVGVNGDPFTALRRGVDGVQADRNFAFQVLANGSLGQHQWYVGSFLAGPKVVVPPCFRVRPHGLHRKRAAVHEQPFVILDDLWVALIVIAMNLSPPSGNFASPRARIRHLPAPFSDVGVVR